VAILWLFSRQTRVSSGRLTSETWAKWGVSVSRFQSGAAASTSTTWLSRRYFQAKGPERVPLFGPLGLTGQLGVQEDARERKFRERLKSWLELVRLYWPECPASLATNGAFLELNRGMAVTPRKNSVTQCRGEH
jgi:hypothetical protein